MPINTALLIAAPMLQDVLVDDQTGLVLANGTITLYQDNSRTTYKNWYYQSGSPGAYTYITLPNPLTLSAAGSIVDNNGNDTIPFYYPYDEVTGAFQPYYIVVQDQFGAQKFVRQNFPFITHENTPGSQDVTLRNYVTNSEFWRNIGSVNATTLTQTVTINGSTIYYTTIAPGNHDGFSMPDIIFAKDANGAVDTLTFQKFTLGSEALAGTNGGVTPEYYFEMNCTGAGTETTKYIQIPIQLHIQNLSGVDASISLWAQDANNASSPITIKIFQFNGTGATSPAAVVVQSITLTSNWQFYTVNFPMPDVTGAVLGGGSDDAWYMQIGYPVASTANINIALPSFYLGNILPTNDFQSYDEINSIISCPRTGDVRTSINSFAPFGWVPANDGTLGDSSSNATTRANSDTFQLYSLIWNVAKPYDSGADFNPIAQLYTSGGVADDYGSSAIVDFNANKALALTKSMGKVMMGDASVLLSPYTQTATASASPYDSTSLLITVPTTVGFWNGMPVVFTNSGGALPGNVVANAVYYIGGVNFTSANTLYLTTSYANAITVSAVIQKSGSLAALVIQFSSTGSGTTTMNIAGVGSATGEDQHTLLSGELPNPLTSTANTFAAAAGGTAVIKSDTSTGSGVVSSALANLAFNVLQPGTFYNIFVKL